jgi:sigma-E factor negative regulatory protein RseB
VTVPVRRIGSVRLVLALVAAGSVLLVVGAPQRAAGADSGTTESVESVESIEQVEAEATQSLALDLLTRAARAQRSASYSGLQFVSAWSDGTARNYLVDVDHREGATLLRVRDGRADGQGVAVTVTAPAQTGVSAYGARVSFGGGERGPRPLSDADAATEAQLRLLADNYRLAVGGVETVAGHPARIVEVRRVDGSAAARFWIDEVSALLLRREVYDESGRVLRTSGFLDVEPARRTFVKVLPPALPDPWPEEDAPASDPITAAHRLRAAGWTCPRELGTLSLRAARQLDGAAETSGTVTGEVVHLSYSDGLASVSVFEQRGHLDPAGLAGYRAERVGRGTVHVAGSSPLRVVWSTGGSVYPVVADAPRETVDRIVAALPHDAPADGDVARVQRGMTRIASWLNPWR